jgi:VanZ family protein
MMNPSETYLPPPPPEAPAEPPPFAFRMPVLLLFIAYWLVLIVGTHLPRIPQAVSFNIADKILHFVAYCGLTFGACLAWRLQRPRYASLSWRHYGAVLLVVAVAGAIDEVTQPYVGRACELLDWVADVAGGALGIGLFLAACAVRRWWLGAVSRAAARNYLPTN